MEKRKMKTIPIERILRRGPLSREQQLLVLVDDMYEFSYAFWNLSLFIDAESEKEDADKDSRWLELLYLAYGSNRKGNTSSFVRILRKMEAHLGLRGLVPIIM